jgi:hypothetical protein
MSTFHRFAAIVSVLSIAGLASAVPAAAATASSPPFTFKVQVKGGTTRYCSTQTNSHLLPRQGCLTKQHWAKHGIDIDHKPVMQFVANDRVESGEAGHRN